MAAFRAGFVARRRALYASRIVGAGQALSKRHQTRHKLRGALSLPLVSRLHVFLSPTMRPLCVRACCCGCCSCRVRSFERGSGVGRTRGLAAATPPTVSHGRERWMAHSPVCHRLRGAPFMRARADGCSFTLMRDEPADRACRRLYCCQAGLPRTWRDSFVISLSFKRIS